MNIFIFFNCFCILACVLASLASHQAGNNGMIIIYVFLIGVNIYSIFKNIQMNK